MTNTENPIRVVIVEDDRTVREGLNLIINGTPNFACVGAFRSVEDALRLSDKTPLDVMLLDINLPGMSGCKAVGVFLEKHPQLKILMLTVFAEQEKVFESICNGACGYLLKKTPPARLLEAIKEAHEGGAPMSPEIARQVITLFRQIAPPDKENYRLTPQEVRLLQLLANGFSYQAAAEQLHISINTVRNYIRSIYEKLHVNSKSEAVGKALRHRIIS
ncbi:MAG: response regulator transcription factor [Acidobacteriota bacterium]|nr:response regulator transcription factor [Acidobacteriota bacterium]